MIFAGRLQSPCKKAVPLSEQLEALFTFILPIFFPPRRRHVSTADSYFGFIMVFAASAEYFDIKMYLTVENVMLYIII